MRKDVKYRKALTNLPDLGACENESARCHQTTAMEVFKFNARAAGQRKNAKHRYSRVTAQNKEDTDNAAPASFPHLIALYLRPASLRDAAEMAKIYNFYVENSTMTEDQVAVDVKDMEAMMKKCHASHTPVIVAVLGTAPQAITAHGDETVTVTQYEKAIGFAFARFSEQTGRQLGNKTTTRSSGIAHVQIFVSSQYTRHGIGRCLLDRVLQTLSHAYDANNGYPWVDPHGYSVHEKNRAPHCRQVIIEIPKTRQHDPEFEWKKQWLEKFSTLIKHVATIPSACYAKAQDSDTTPAELDLAIFSLNFGKKCNAVVKDEMDG